MSSKNCSRCKIEKSLDSFSRDKYQQSGYKSACKNCANNDFTMWRSKNLQQARKKDRVKHYQRKYNLSQEQAELLVENRQGVCSICKNVDNLVVDHCHTTSDVRGFICSACNSVLGYSRDNTNTLKAAVQYLEKFYGLQT